MADAQPVDPRIVDIDALTGWMDDNGLGAGPLESVEALAGGTQNLLLRFVREGRTYILRRPPEHKRKNSDETMRREARVLGALADTDVPHPRLIAAEGDVEVLGAAFYLMEPIDGFQATSGLPELHASDPAIRRSMGLSFVDAVLALHGVDPATKDLDGFGKPEGYLERQVPRWQAQLESYNELDGYPGPELPHLVEIQRYLESNLPDPSPTGIIHGDYHLANVMFRPDRGEIAAIVDWELATRGDPLIDLGLIVAFWPDDETAGGMMSVQPWDGFPTIDELVTHYGERSSRSIEAVDWYAVLACYKTGIILEGTHARAFAGKASKEFGDLLHATTVSLFEKAGRIIGLPST
jgi:aminoglycoside phosphotransferase (APT) family kinase protein